MSGIVCLPEWLTADGVKALFGLPRTRLYELRIAGEICWKRLPVRAGNGVRGRVLYSAESIRWWLAKL